LKQSTGTRVVTFVGAVVYLATFYAVFRYRLLSWRGFYDHLELIGPIALIVVLLALKYDSLGTRRPFNFVPPDGSWWEYVVFGITAAVFGMISIAAMICAAAILPFLLPIKVMLIYVLGQDATLVSALIAFPLVFLTISLVFAAIYLWLMLRNKGHLNKSNQPLYTGKAGEGWPFVEVYYFSLSTMLKGAPQYEASGWCRWVALGEIAIARLLEVGIVTVGIGAILKRGVGH
jgi:hypothetical protein